jgi:hypothetical protein
MFRNAATAPALWVGTVHHAGIELDHAVFIGQPAITDAVIVGVAFDDVDPGNHRVERVRAGLQHGRGFVRRRQSVGAGHNHRPAATTGWNRTVAGGLRTVTGLIATAQRSTGSRRTGSNGHGTDECSTRQWIMHGVLRTN